MGRDLLFFAFALVVCGGAVAVVVSQNVVRMAFWLILSLGSTAGLFFLLQADLVATAQLLVYVGGTLVLLIFGVMLTASGPYATMKTNPGEAVLAGMIAAALLALIGTSVGSADWNAAGVRDTTEAGIAVQNGLRRGYSPPEEGTTTRSIGMALIGPRPDRDLGRTTTSLATGYLLPFEIASVHLLVVLVGAAYLARAKRRINPS